MIGLRDTFRGRARSKDKKLVASNYGLPPRRLWFELNTPREPGGRPASDIIRFLYGSILEELVLLLAREANHTVTEEQAKVNVNGVSGRKDARIDGVTTDVKSASGFSFKKFQNGEMLLGDEGSDPFGYRYQLGLYMEPTNDQEGSFLVINKETGQLTSVILDRYDIPDVPKKIEEARALVELPWPPEEKCYPEKPYGKSGNMIIHTLCTFCDHKEKCWEDANDGKGLLTHEYASGKVFFSKLVKPPREKKEENESAGDNIDNPREEPTTDVV